MPIERATSGVPATTAIWKEGTTYEAGAHACIPYKVDNRWYSHNYICIVGRWEVLLHEALACPFLTRPSAFGAPCRPRGQSSAIISRIDALSHNRRLCGALPAGHTQPSMRPQRSVRARFRRVFESAVEGGVRAKLARRVWRHPFLRLTRTSNSGCRHRVNVSRLPSRCSNGPPLGGLEGFFTQEDLPAHGIPISAALYVDVYKASLG
ncbi:hypothetical protein EV122DRAFT_272525 [Schizophyllum commune]